MRNLKYIKQINFLISITFLISIMFPAKLFSQDTASTGSVIDVRQDRVFIELKTGNRPAIGDMAELSFELAGEKFVIGTWRVTDIKGPVIEAAEVKADLTPEQGMDVMFITASKKADSTAVSSPLPAQSAKTRLETRTTRDYLQIWTDRGSGARRDFAVWRPMAGNGFYPLGDVSNAGPWRGGRYSQPEVQTIMVRGGVPPVDYEFIWSSRGSGSDRPFSTWKPIAPPGYRCLGDVGSTSENSPPPREAIRCVPVECTVETRLEGEIWTDRGSGADLDYSAWRIPRTNTFIGIDAHAKPRGAVFTLDDRCM